MQLKAGLNFFLQVCFQVQSSVQIADKIVTSQLLMMYSSYGVHGSFLENAAGHCMFQYYFVYVLLVCKTFEQPSSALIISTVTTLVYLGIYSNPDTLMAAILSFAPFQLFLLVTITILSLITNSVATCFIGWMLWYVNITYLLDTNRMIVLFKGHMQK